MQILLGLSDLGQVLHTELVTLARPIQLMALARARLAHFPRIEVWEDTVCVLRCPPVLADPPA
jgi:hypothetical protein